MHYDAIHIFIIFVSSLWCITGFGQSLIRLFINFMHDLSAVFTHSTQCVLDWTLNSTNEWNHDDSLIIIFLFISTNMTATIASMFFRCKKVWEFCALPSDAVNWNPFTTVWMHLKIQNTNRSDGCIFTTFGFVSIEPTWKRYFLKGITRNWFGISAKQTPLILRSTGASVARHLSPSLVSPNNQSI